MCVCVCVCVCVEKIKTEERYIFSDRSYIFLPFLPFSIYIQSEPIYPSRVGRGSANGPEDLGSIPGRVIPKTVKMVLDTALLHTQQYEHNSRIKLSNPEKGVTPSPTPRCNCYWKGSLLVALDYGRQLYNLLFTPPRALELEPHHQMQLGIILRTPLFWCRRVLPFCRGYSLRIISCHR